MPQSAEPHSVHVILSGIMAPGSVVLCARGRRPLTVAGYNRNVRRAGRGPAVQAILGQMPFVHVADVDELAPASAIVIRPSQQATITPARGNPEAFDLHIAGVDVSRVLGPFDSREDALETAGVAEAVYEWQAAVQRRLASWGAEALTVAERLVRGGLYVDESALHQAAMALSG